MKKILLCLPFLTLCACDNGGIEGRCLTKYGVYKGITQNSQVESERMVHMCSCFESAKSEEPIFNLPVTTVISNVSTCDIHCTKLCKEEQNKRNAK